MCSLIDVKVRMKGNTALRGRGCIPIASCPGIPHVLWDMPLGVIDQARLSGLHLQRVFGPLSVLHETQTERAVAQRLRHHGRG